MTPSHSTSVTVEDTVEEPYPPTFARGTTSNPSSAHSNRRSTTTLLQCNVAGCEYERSFARKFELRRHIDQKHGGARIFTCGALGCFKRGNSPCTFARLDKLTDHIRTVHALDTAFSGCPAIDCKFGPHALDVLAAHIQRSHPRCEAEARSIKNVTTAKRRRCPLSGCNNKLFSLELFVVHLTKHEAKDIHASRSNPSFEGFHFEFNSIPIGEEFAITRVDISIACPVCLLLSATFEDFEAHLWAAHLFLDPLQGAQHFLAWRDALTHVKNTSSSILPWDNSRVYFSKHSGVKCPACAFDTSDATYMKLQHPDLMKPDEHVVRELKPFRMQILRLYPEFLTHPIFDDLA